MAQDGGRAQVAAALQTVVNDFGRGVAQNGPRLRALLNDVLGADARQLNDEIEAVVADAPIVAASDQGPLDPSGFSAPWLAAAWTTALGAGASETVLPPASETVLPPASETVLPPTSETVLPPASETVLPETPVPPRVPPAPQVPKKDTGMTPSESWWTKLQRGEGLKRVGLVGAILLLVLAGGAVVMAAGGDDGGTGSTGGTDSGGTTDDATDSGGTDDEGTDEGTTDDGGTDDPPPPLEECPEPDLASDLQAEVDILSGIEVRGVVSKPEQLMTLAGMGLTLPTDLTGVTVQAGGPSQNTLNALAYLLPSLDLNMASGRVVATESGVCVQGSYIDDTAASDLDTRVKEARTNGVSIDSIIEQHPPDNHDLHVEILKRALNRAFNDRAAVFADGSAQFTPASAAVLDEVVDILLNRFTDLSDQKVTVEGHTSTTGNPAFNKQLSEDRANAVMHALIERGIPASRLQAAGHGAEDPLCHEDTEACHARNRRVVFNVGQEHGEHLVEEHEH